MKPVEADPKDKKVEEGRKEVEEIGTRQLGGLNVRGADSARTSAIRDKIGEFAQSMTQNFRHLFEPRIVRLFKSADSEWARDRACEKPA